MRYVELSVRPEDRWFHPIDERIAAEATLSHGPIHHAKRLRDGTVILLFEIHGAPERAQAVIASAEHYLTVETSTVDDISLVYARIQPSDVVRTLLEIVDRHGIVIDTPLRFADDDELQVTVVGEADRIRAAFADAPAATAVTVVKTGEYRPQDRRLFAELTDRQQEILRTALKLGYYETPRTATYEDIAAATNCSATTVGEHLRKVEGYILRSVVPTTS